jgi:O-antigen/teichoic acid export membrane protein
MSTRKVFATSFFENYVNTLLGLGLAVFAARTLTPSQIGTFQLAMIFLAVASTLRDFGLTEYVVQEKDASRDVLSSALGLNLLVSLLVCILLFGLSFPIAQWMRSAEVGEAVRWLCINLLLIPLGAVSIACLKRNLAANKLLFCTIAGASTTVAVGVYGILSGWGLWSLVASTIAGNAITVVMANVFRPKEVPLWPSLKKVGLQIQFGKRAASIYGLAQACKLYPDQLIGRVMNPESVAYFSRAGSLIEIFQSAFGRAVLGVCMPVFAKSARSNALPAQSALQATSLFCVVGWPAAACMAILAQELLLGIFGPQWTASIRTAQIMCLVLFMEMPFLYYREFLIAHGHIKQAVALQFKLAASRIACFTIGIYWGLEGGALGLAVASVVNLVLFFHFFRTNYALSPFDLLRVFRQSILIAVACAAVCWLAHIGIVRVGVKQQLVIVLLTSIPVFFVWVIIARASSPLAANELNRIGMKIKHLVMRR